MIRPAPRRLRRFFGRFSALFRAAAPVAAPAAALAAALVLGGCGQLVIGGGSGPYDTSAPAKRGGQGGGKTAGASGRPAVAPVFRTASAVTVGPGDTVYALSRRHGAPVRAIIEANGLKPPFHLRPGQRIVLPRPPTHRVNAGETLYAIARAAGASPYEIARANGLTAPYTIHPGDILIVPSILDSPPPPKPARRTAAASALAAEPAPKPAAQPAAQSAAQSAVRAPEPAPKAAPKVKSKPKLKSSAAAPPKASGKGFMWPAQGRVLSGYGPKSKGLFNDGVNIAAEKGAPVRASDTGVVAYAGNELKGFGNLILVRHAGGWVTAYAHTDSVLVKRGQKVKRGERIATIGATGGVTRPQLHFEIRKGRKAVNPAKKLPKRPA